MAMLHTVNKSPFERSTLESCISLAAKGSSILLIEDGVYAAVKDTAKSAMVKDAMQNVAFYALGPDVAARGISEDQVMDGIKLVDYEGFVDLAVENDKVNAWL